MPPFAMNLDYSERSLNFLLMLLELATLKVQYFDTVANRKNLFNVTEAGQKLGMSSVIRKTTLKKLDVYNPSVKRSRVFQQLFIDLFFDELKQTEPDHPQSKFTHKGDQWIHEKLVNEGVL